MLYPCEISSGDRVVRGWLDDEGTLVNVEPGSIGLEEARSIVTTCETDSAVDVAYGVFEWVATGIYPERNAIRIFKRLSAAEKFADRENAKNNTSLVVRTIY